MLLAVVVLLVTAPVLQPLMAQQASRYALTAALWDGQTITVDAYDHLLSVDRAERDGRVYSDKAPGQPLLAVPAYAAYRALGGHPNLVQVAKTILARGPKHLIVKRGEYGVLFFNQKQMFGAPAFPLEEVKDPTGAGDTFAGGFMGYLASRDGSELTEMDFRLATMYGSAIASFTVEAFSTERLQNLSAEEIAGRVDAALAELGLLADSGDGRPAGKSKSALRVAINGINANAGRIDVRSDQIQGSGSWIAPGDAAVRIVNDTPAFLKLRGISISQSTGGLYFNGGLVESNADASRISIAFDESRKQNRPVAVLVGDEYHGFNR